jgi:hypothetical protein
MPNIYDREDQKKLEEIRQKLIERQRSDMRKTLSTPEGRRVIWRILSDSGPFQTPYAGPGNDSLTFLNIGKKESALILYAEIEATQPDLLLAMRREAASDKLLHEAEIKGAQNV